MSCLIYLGIIIKARSHGVRNAHWMRLNAHSIRIDSVYMNPLQTESHWNDSILANAEVMWSVTPRGQASKKRLKQRMAGGWTNDATKALIGIWGESNVQNQLDNVKRNRDIYEGIAKRACWTRIFQIMEAM